MGLARAAGIARADAKQQIEHLVAALEWEAMDDCAMTQLIETLEESSSWTAAVTLIQQHAEAAGNHKLSHSEPVVAPFQGPAGAIPDAMGCAICCEELMLKPVSLQCGHSFCMDCIKEWTRNCKSCPTCRSALEHDTSMTFHVNRALQDLSVALFPHAYLELEQRNYQERYQRLRTIILEAIESGQASQLLTTAQARHPAQSRDNADPLTIASVVQSDELLQAQLLALETRERLRRDRMLREESRRRHRAAYCSVISSSTPPTSQEAQWAFSRSSHVEPGKRTTRTRILGSLWGKKT